MSDKKVEETYKRLKREHLYYVGRNLCEILEDMRKMHEVRNYSGLLAAIEEAQAIIVSERCRTEKQSLIVAKLFGVSFP